ncbi:MAG TPA: aspartate-semialdehyde dehydrogenase [Candidatus Eremiobacteraceae bacterium]|nr:aspartate-semialdehyde dehydrogenase [Candidatus Eremiobacteraceae bacterium]
MIRLARIAIVGAAGLVGETVLRVLEERGYSPDALALFGGERSAGTTRAAFGREWPIKALRDESDLAGFDAVFFAADSGTSKRFAKPAAKAGAVVVDKSSLFRLDPDVPLVVPEVNGDALAGARLIANPNCATIPLAMALAPIARAFGLEWTSVATYQSVSGAGRDALDEFRAQGAGSDEARVLPRRIAGNVVPENGVFDADGNGDEERKIAAELRKILALPALPVSATSVRVPVAVGHCEAVAFGTRDIATREDVAATMRSAAGVRFLDGSGYATALDVAGTDDVVVGRLRADGAHPGAWLCWVSCDNLRKGAATNAVQVVETALAPSRKVAV